VEGPAIVRSGQGSQRATSAPASEDRKPVIVTVKRRPGRFGDVPDMTPEEHRRRGDAAEAQLYGDGDVDVSGINVGGHLSDGRDKRLYDGQITGKRCGAATLADDLRNANGDEAA
jgi:hypothetical protein